MMSAGRRQVRRASATMSEPSTQSSVALGLIGCGRAAQRLHLPALSALGNAKIVAVAEPAAEDEAVAKVIRKHAPDATVYGGWRELLRDENVEAVVIALPTPMHARVAVAALAAGKHVYVEKPIAINMPDARRVLRAADLAEKKHGRRVVMTGFNYRFNPTYKKLRDLLAADAVGDVVAVRSAFCSPARELPGWKQDRKSGGGALLDLFSHHADLLPWVLGERVNRVSASILSRQTSDDTASVSLTFANGVVGQCLHTISGSEVDEIEVVGTRGRIVADRINGQIHRFPRSRPSERGDKLRAAAGQAKAAPARLRATVAPQAEPSHRMALSHFVNRVQDGAPPRVTLADGYNAAALVDAAEASAATGQSQVPDLVDVAAAPADVEGGPALTAILVAATKFADVARTEKALRRQTIVGDVELVVVGPDAAALADAPADLDAAGYHSVKRVHTDGPIDNVDTAAAGGILAASASILGLVEDHAFPEPDWAERIVAAHRAAKGGPYVAIGSGFENANPDTPQSWCNLLLAYGSWVGPNGRGPATHVSRHNISYDRDLLLAAVGDDLDRRLGRDGNILGTLLKQGHRFYLEPAARVRHLNPSKTASTRELRFNAGRLYAATRADAGKWSTPKRLFYAAASPLFPAMRLKHLGRRTLVAQDSVGWRLWPSLLWWLTVDAAGQAIGFAAGPGKTAQTLAAFEFDRARHMTDADRQKVDTALEAGPRGQPQTPTARAA